VAGGRKPPLTDPDRSWCHTVDPDKIPRTAAAPASKGSKQGHLVGVEPSTACPLLLSESVADFRQFRAVISGLNRCHRAPRASVSPGKEGRCWWCFPDHADAC